MNQVQAPLINEQEQLAKILSLLETTYSSNDTEQIKIAQEQLNIFSSDFASFTSLLYKSLLISSIKGKEISLDLHKSVVIYLRNILLKQANELEPALIFDSLKNIISLFFSWDKNINLNNEIITKILQNIVSSLLSINSISDEPKYIQSIFSDIYKLFIEENEYTKESNILITSQKVVGLSVSLLTSKGISKSYEALITKFFLPIVDKIFNLGKNYINPKINMYNDTYLLILRNLYDGFYSIFSNLNMTLHDEHAKICTEIFKKYWKYSIELIHLNPLLTETNIKKFGKQNPIIIFNINDSDNFNLMKSRVIQLLSYAIQSICSISNDYDFIHQSRNKINEGNDNNGNEILLNKKKSITDKDLISCINDMIKLTVKCFEDLLSNQEKYYFVRNYEMELYKNNNGINIILYELCVFLTRVLIRQPFKSTFRNDIKLFLLNILIPLFSTNETEKNNIEKDFYMYQIYINDITEEFKIKNFRTSGMYLIKKICEHFADESNFILSFILEMFNYTINNGNIQNSELNYNIYLENRDKFMIDKLGEEAKIDFFLLLILLLVEQIDKNTLIKNHLKKLLIENQEKMNKIQSLSIKIKICKVYSVFIPILFKSQKEVNISMNRIYKKAEKNEINNNINQNKENENNKFMKEYKFIQNAFDYLLKNIEQNITQNTTNGKKEYYQSLSNIAAECISQIIESFKEINDEEDDEDISQDNNNSNTNKRNDFSSVNNYISKSLSDNFKIIIDLILIIDNPSFYNLIDYVIEYIKAQNRQDIFICLRNVTNKFIGDFEKNKEKENEIKPFVLQYFKILSSFLKGVNKLNKNDPNEIKLFEEILDKIFNIINIDNLENFEDNDELIRTMEDYVEAVECINEKSIRILKHIYPKIKNEDTFSNSVFFFLSTFMKFLPKSNNLSENIKMELIEEIIKIIKLSFTYSDEIYDQSIKNVLLLTLKLFNICINQISFNTFKELLLLSLNSYAPFSKDDVVSGEISEKAVINQLCLCNIAIGFIFRPVESYKIIFEQNNNCNTDSQEKNKNENNAILSQNNNPSLNLFINLLFTSICINNSCYIILLNKCIILGLCSLYKEDYCRQKLNLNPDIYCLLLQTFIKLVDKHKKEQIDHLNKLMKKEINCNFIEEQENEEEEDEEDEDMEEIKDSINNILNENENIKNANEYKFFSETINSIKNNDNKIFEIINQGFKGIIDELLLLRTININYKGKQFEVPRKTVKIIRK